MKTLIPDSSNLRAIANPIPARRLTPVTTATRPAIASLMFNLTRHDHHWTFHGLVDPLLFDPRPDPPGPGRLGHPSSLDHMESTRSDDAGTWLPLAFVLPQRVPVPPDHH